MADNSALALSLLALGKAGQGGGGGTTYTAGEGIAINSDNEISALVDGETIQFNEDGELIAVGGSTEIPIIIPTLSQVISIDPLTVQFTTEQSAIIEDENVVDILFKLSNLGKNDCYFKKNATDASDNLIILHCWYGGDSKKDVRISYYADDKQGVYAEVTCGGSEVSGTNDGTNWTSLTIDDDTYDIPSDGGSSDFYWCEYGTTTYEEIEEAVEDGKLPIFRLNSTLTAIYQLTYGNEHKFTAVYKAADGIHVAYYRCGIQNNWGFDGDTLKEVSGTNDGTNWTSLTIDDDTYAIPSGGGGGTEYTAGNGIEIADVDWEISWSGTKSHWNLIEIFYSNCSLDNFNNIFYDGKCSVSLTIDGHDVTYTDTLESENQTIDINDSGIRDIQNFSDHMKVYLSGDQDHTITYIKITQSFDTPSLNVKISSGSNNLLNFTRNGELNANFNSGDGIDINGKRISAKVDNETIQFNNFGELEAIGGGGSSYMAGKGIKISEEDLSYSINWSGSKSSNRAVDINYSDCFIDNWDYQFHKGLAKVVIGVDGDEHEIRDISVDGQEIPINDFGIQKIQNYNDHMAVWIEDGQSHTISFVEISQELGEHTLLSVKADGETIQFNNDGELEAIYGVPESDDDGTYVLKCTIVDGEKTFSWVRSK